MVFLEDHLDEALRVEREFSTTLKNTMMFGHKAYDRQGLIDFINKLAKDYRTDNDKWWRDPATGVKFENPNFDRKLLLIVGEIIEAHEGMRKGIMDKHLPHRKAECVELADAFIRMMDYVGERHPDFGEAVVEKIEYNRTREDHKVENRLAPGGKKF